jgi:general secretion pathway protein D
MKARYNRRWITALIAGSLLQLAAGALHAQDITTLTTTTKTEIPIVAKGVEAPPTKDLGLRFNFRGASLDLVLDYLAKAAGFIIVREATVQGTVDVVSHRDLNRDEAVALLNTILNQKGYAAIRNEQTLRIVTLEDARKRDIPVKMGRSAEKIKKTDEMITQVIPVHYSNATQLVKNLEALLPPYAVISANESSNAVVLTATQTDARRMVQIIEALDTSISNVSSLKVYILKHADATELAKLIGDLFKPPASASTSNNNRGGMPPFGPMMMFGMGRRGQNAGNSGDSSTRQVTPTVTAVADTRTNAVVVSAPDEVVPTLDQLVEQIDTSSEMLCEIRVFTLKYAEAQNTAQLINDIFQKDKQTNTSNNANQGFGGGFMRRFMGGGGNQSSTPSDSRKAQESTVLAVADVRTNSVVINADKDLMDQVAMMIQKLDKNPAKDKKVFVYSLKYADAQQTAAILEGMFGDGTSQNNHATNQSVIFDNNSSTQNSGNSSRSSGGSVPNGMSLP